MAITVTFNDEQEDALYRNLEGLFFAAANMNRRDILKDIISIVDALRLAQEAGNSTPNSQLTNKTNDLISVN